MENLFIIDEAKELAWKAFISRTTEEEYYYIHRKEAKLDFEKWWNENSKHLIELLKRCR